MANLGDEREIRIEKLSKIRSNGVNPYLDKSNRTHNLLEAKSLEVGTKDVELYGRLMLKRVFGKLIFATLQDFFGRMQIALNIKDMAETDYLFF